MRRRGFTLVEVMVGAAIMLVILAIVHRLWSTMTRAGTTELWATEVSGRLTGSDASLREKIARAGYPTLMTVQGVLAPSPPARERYRIQVASGGDVVSEPAEGGTARSVRSFAATGSEDAAAGRVVLGMYAITPGAVGVEGRSSGPATGSRVRLLLARGHKTAHGGVPLADLVMEEAPLAYASSVSLSALPDLDGVPPVGAAVRRVLVPDVTRVGISACRRNGNNLQEVDSASAADEPCTVRLTVECREPFRGARTIARTMVADAHVGVTLSGAP